MSASASKKGSSSAPEDRRSGRLRTKVRVRSVVDPETRRLVALQRLAALEQDNYEEPAALTAAQAADGAYVDDEEEEEVAQGGGKSRKRKAGRSGGATAASNKEGKDRASKFSGPQNKLRNLDHVVAMEEYDSDPESGSINYKTIAAGPSAKPTRHFCSVCGYMASYTCTRCGLRFCCLRCQHTHKETRCLKFAE